MSKGTVNKVILIGNLGEDPQINQMNNQGDLAANMTLATTETWKDQQGAPQERTEWHRVKAYRGLATLAQQYLCKGSKIFIEGKLQTRKYKDQSGQDQFITEIVIDNMEMLGGRRKDQNDQGNNQGGYQQQNNQGNNQGGYPQNNQQAMNNQNSNQGGYQQQNNQQAVNNQGGYNPQNNQR